MRPVTQEQYNEIAEFWNAKESWEWGEKNSIPVATNALKRMNEAAQKIIELNALIGRRIPALHEIEVKNGEIQSNDSSH
jgi:hypothetical protein